MAPSPQRQQLAEKIADLRVLEAEAEMLQRAAGPALEAWRRARAELERAREAVETTARDAVSHRIAALAGDGGDAAPPSVEDARRVVRVAEDDVAAANLAREEIERRTETNRKAVDWRRASVRDEAQATLWGEAQPAILTLAEQARAAQVRWIEKLAELGFLLDLAPRPFPNDAELIEARSVSRGVAPKMEGDPAASWRTALDELQRDATAKLPR